MRARLYRPAKSASQSGKAKASSWVLEPEILSARTPERLMGWSSSSDTLGEMRGRLRFATQEAALSFARRKGWECTVDDAHDCRVTPRNYLDNFRIVRPDDEERRATKANV